MNNFYSEEELIKIGFKSFGKNVLVSRNANIHSASQITLGNNVRIDDFCVLSGKIEIGNYAHIATHCCLFGGAEGIVVNDFCGLSSRVAVYAASDDYSGEALTNPMVPEKYRNVINSKVVLERHVLVATGCTILPGVLLAEGSAFGAMTLINKNSEPWSINIGVPYKKIKKRSKNLLILEKDFLNKVENE